MIQVRKNALSGDSLDIGFVENETVSDLVKRAIEEVGYEYSDNMVHHFAILVNGHLVDRAFWHLVPVVESDNILISPVIAGGSFGQVFKQIAIIAIVAGAAAFLGPGALGISGLGLEGLSLGLATGAAGFFGSMLLNSLIPPPNPSGGIGSQAASYEGSQMYTITSQGNTPKKFGYVPKVYGRHRMFPIVAANPYTEIEADPDTGGLVQYFYCVYDFGLGPNKISNLMIGDTQLDIYSDVEYRFVDFNRPLVDEGEWDTLLNNTLEFYKGDVERDGSSYALDKNQSDGGSLEDYQVIRNASPKVQGNMQEISVDFVAPTGLIAYGTDGSTSTRTIEMLIEFSKVGEENWHPYNDPDYVIDFKAAGGSDNVYDEFGLQMWPFYTGYDSLNVESGKNPYYVKRGGLTYIHVQGDNSWRNVQSFGFPQTNYIVGYHANVSVGRALYYMGNLLGIVTSIEDFTFTPEELPNGYQDIPYKKYNLDRNVNFDTELYSSFYAGEIGPGFHLYLIVNRTDTLYLDRPPQGLTVKYFSAGKLGITGQSASTVYATAKFKPKEVSQYKVRITRLITYSSASFQLVDKLNLASISTRFDRNPIVTTKRHTFLELKIRATNQISGSVSNLSGIVESVLDVYNEDDEVWEKQITNNPAWVYCDILTGQINKNALNKSRLNLDTILEWRDFCDEIPPSPPGYTNTQKRFQCNFVMDYDNTVQSAINTVTSAAQASLNLIDGKYGVLLDKLKTVPVQIFTPRNSWGFNSTRKYVDTPHALKVRYVDPGSVWEVADTIVYDDGYDEETALTFEEMSTFACTNEEQAWRFGRYMLASSRLRQENISINVDFEHLVCTRGDYVQITQDVMKVGGRPARVKTVSGIRITIDDSIDTSPSLDYGYKFRSVANGISDDATLTVISSDTFDLDGDIPSIGDIIIIGEVGLIVFDCLVKSISPNSDLSAVLSLVEKADAIYDSESTSTIPAYSPQLTTNIDDSSTPGRVEDLIVTDNTWRFTGAGYEYYIGLDWDTPSGSAVDFYEIYVNSGKGFGLVGSTLDSFYEYIVDPRNLGINHDFKVLAVSSTGKKLDLIAVDTVSATPIEKLTPPSDVSDLYINITGEVIQLDWASVVDTDIKEYLIRYNPTSIGTWETSIPLLRTAGKTTLASTQGRVGTYLIKALDFNGNESENAALAITSIPNLFDLNIIEEINDFPDLLGTTDQVVIDSTAIILQSVVVGGAGVNEYYSEGYYYFYGLLNLGDIYTARVQSLIEAEGYTVGDLMSNWVTLDSVEFLSNSEQSDWDVEAQVRTTASFNVMSEWISLASIDPISEGDPDTWSPWRKVTIGDFTGRVMQFRLRLISNKADVTPRVINGRMKIDMPDRLESYNNLIATDIGLEVDYSPAFYGPSAGVNIQITQDAAQSGDYYLFDYKTLDGFKITFYDKDDLPVTRQFDASIKGFGRRALASI